jgi:hypothetical protein
MEPACYAFAEPLLCRCLLNFEYSQIDFALALLRFDMAH